MNVGPKDDRSKRHLRSRERSGSKVQSWRSCLTPSAMPSVVPRDAAKLPAKVCVLS